MNKCSATHTWENWSEKLLETVMRVHHNSDRRQFWTLTCVLPEDHRGAHLDSIHPMVSWSK